MTDKELLDWIDALDEIEVSGVEATDGLLLIEVTADDLYVGHGRTIREAIRTAHANWVARKAIPPLSIEDMANTMRPAFGLARKPWREDDIDGQ